jgi:ADP-ribosylglycohydrolase
VEWVAGLAWNQWPDCRGIGGRFGVELVATLPWNTHACEESTFAGVVKAAAALGNDTDTTACIAGGLAGIHFGFDGIPLRWMDILRGRELVKPLERGLLLRG